MSDSGKRAWLRIAAAVLAVVCLANTQGGRIYVGVEDDGRITGLQPRHRDPSGMAALIFNQTNPPQSVRVSILEEEGHQVAEVQVDRSDRPVSNAKGTYQRRRLKGDGTPECAPFLSHEFATRASDLGLLAYSALPVRGATLADLNPLERVHLDPQVVHNDTLVEHERPWLGRVREPRPAARFSATPTSLGRHAPKLDEHTDEVLAELGHSPADIAALRAAGIIGPHH